MTDKPGGKPPNLLFIFPDEMRRQAVGAMDADPVITPNLDRLAAEGLVLTNVVSNFPVCSPYRAMLMTGKYPFSNGVIHNCLSAPVAKTSYLRAEDRCLSDVLHDAGYSLGYIGKWHLERPHEPYVEPPRDDGYVWDEFPPPERRHGFDFWHAYNCYDKHLAPHYWPTQATRDHKLEVGEWSVKHEVDTAVEYLENADGTHRDPNQPFALFVAHNPPHMPFEAVPEQYVEMYGDRTADDLLTRPNVDLSIDDGRTAYAKQWVKHYFAAVTGIDDNLGRLLECLKREGLEENTIVVFTSDHGEMMGSHNLMYKNWWYEESLGVPFIIRWPGKIAPGRDDLLFSAPDNMPTLLGLMGLGGMVPEAVQGADRSSILRGRGGNRPPSALYLEIDPTHPTLGRRGLRTHQHTFVIDRTAGRAPITILHDNRKDPYQIHNIADQSPSLVHELTQEMKAWLETTLDPWAKA